MTITSIKRDWGPNVSIVRLETTDTPEVIVQSGWLQSQMNDIEIINNGSFEWKTNDVLLISYPSPFNTPDVNQAAFFHIFPAFDSVNPINPIYPNLQNITAHAGGGQANATQLNLGINSVTVVATALDSVKLPEDVLGQTVVIRNYGANNLNIFPGLGDSINALAVNTAVFLPPGIGAMFIGTNATNWTTIPN